MRTGTNWKTSILEFLEESQELTYVDIDTFLASYYSLVVQIERAYDLDIHISSDVHVIQKLKIIEG